MRLVGVRETTHAAHDTENVVVGSIDANLGSLDTLNGSVGENKLKSSVVNAREVATAAGLTTLLFSLFSPTLPLREQAEE